MDIEIEEGIERYIKHVRRMSLLTDDQIKAIISYANNPQSDYIDKIRQLALYSDDQLKSILRDAANRDPELRNVFIESSHKKLLSELTEMAKDIKSDPRKFARKIDEEIDFVL